MSGSSEEDFHRNNAYSLYDLYGHTPEEESSLPWNTQSWHFLQKNTFPWSGGLKIFYCLSPFPTDAIFQIWLSMA